MSGFYTFPSLASTLLTFHLPRSCLTTSVYVFLGCSLTKLSPTTNFQYTLDQELSSVFFQISSLFPIFKMFKKAHWNKENKILSFLQRLEKWWDSWNWWKLFWDFEICFTLELHMVKEMVQKMMHKHNEVFNL